MPELLIALLITIVVSTLFFLLWSTYRPQTTDRPITPSCPDCGLRIPLEESRCLRCGWGPASVEPRAQRIMQQLQRHLELLSKRELLSPEVTRQLRMTIHEELERLDQQQLAVPHNTGIQQPSAVPGTPVIIGLDAAPTVLQPAPSPGSISVTAPPPAPATPRPRTSGAPPSKVTS